MTATISRVFVGGGCKGGHPVSGKDSTKRPTPETHTFSAAEIENMARAADRRAQATAEENKKREDYRLRVEQLKNTHPDCGTVIQTTHNRPAVVWADKFPDPNDKNKTNLVVWVLLDVYDEYPHYPEYYIRSDRKFGMKLFLTKKQINSVVLKADPAIAETVKNSNGLCMIQSDKLNIKKIKIIGYSNKKDDQGRVRSGHAEVITE